MRATIISTIYSSNEFLSPIFREFRRKKACSLREWGWRDPDNPYRKDLLLSRIPTLVEFDRNSQIVAKLVESEIWEDDKLKNFINM
jgi:hypothetical protein